jgi:glycosyltransferase involved in cell wall biosynthesis
MRIVIPILGFGHSGGYRVLSELANSFIDKGHQVVFLCIERRGSPYFPTKADIMWVNYKGFVNTNNPQPRKKENITTFIGNQIALMRGLCVLKKIDIILANDCFTVLPVYLAKTTAKKVYYIQAYEPDFFIGKKGLKSKCGKFISWFSYHLGLFPIVNAPLYLNYKCIRAKDFVYPGINFSLFNDKNRKNNDIFTIGCVGRAEPIKGIPEVFDAYKLLKNKGLNVTLKVAFGRGIELPQGAELIIPNGDAELADFYRSVDVIIAVVRRQLGAVHYPVSEAMACGTPVITTGFFPATPENAWIVPVQDVEKIAEAVQIIMNNPELAKAKTALAKTKLDTVSWENVSKKMMDIFTSL